MTQLPTIIVPARLESTRFNRKLLHEIQGKALIIWTAQRLQSEVPDYPLYFAVDAPELEECLLQEGYQVVMTQKDHQSGTDRIAEANQQIGAEYVINVQGDEPLIQRQEIELLTDCLKGDNQMATIASPFKCQSDFEDHNQVKVVLDEMGNALYFSRAAIPFNRNTKGTASADWLQSNHCYKHIGLYAYTSRFLEQFVQLEVGSLESIEKLEQLRVLEKGFKIKVAITKAQTIGIDTKEDIEIFKTHLSS